MLKFLGVKELSDGFSFNEKEQKEYERLKSYKHYCDVCGKGTDIWIEGEWQWYGSLLDLDEGNIIKTCSDDCRNNLKVKK